MILAPLLIRAASAALVLGVLGSGVAWWNRHEREIGRAEVQEQWNAEKLAQAKLDAEAAQENQRLQARWNANSQEAQDAKDKALARARGARDAAATERERLRDTIDAIEAERLTASETEPACGPDANATVSRDLLGACAERYQIMAGEAGELAARLGGLQVWVRGVCTEPVIEGGKLDR